MDDKPDTSEDLHIWAQAMKDRNDRLGIRSEDLVKQWNDERKNAR